MSERRRLIMANQAPPVEYPHLCFTANSANSAVTIKKSGTLSTNPSFEYSTNGTSWSTMSFNSPIQLASIGSKIYLRGNNTNGISVDEDNYCYFQMSGSISASGNIMSLIDNGACETLTIPRAYCFECLFMNCSSLTTAPQLPATSLKQGCYWETFYGCDNLRTAPALPATSLAQMCYCEMFCDCSSLVYVPVLPATTLAGNCYWLMFNGCSSLQVSDVETSAASYAWTIPANGVFSNTLYQSNVFAGCAGTRQSNYFDGEAGHTYTYYTQNPPIF